MRYVGLPDFYWKELIEYVVSRPYAEVSEIVDNIKAYGKNINIADEPVDKKEET